MADITTPTGGDKKAPLIQIEKDEPVPAVATYGAASDGEETGSRFRQLLSSPRSTLRARIMYGLLLLVGFVIALVLQYCGHWVMEKSATVNKTCNGDNTCIGAQAVYRISFGCFIFFFVHWVMTSKWMLCLEPSARLQFQMFPMVPKFCILLPLFVVLFFIPNEFFVFYAWICFVLAILFLIGQLLILLEFSYAWSDSWAEKEGRYLTGLMICTGFLIVASLVFIGLGYYWFGSKPECGVQQAIVTLTLFGALLYFPLSIMAPSGSLLPSAVVLAYTTYEMFSALQGQAAGECNRIGSTNSRSIIMGTVFSGVALVYSSVTAGSSHEAFTLSEDEDQDEGQDGKDLVVFGFFHLQMMMGAAYISMLLTHWGIVGGEHLKNLNPDTATPMWAKFSSEILCVILYIWTLAAPLLCKSREFG